MSRVVIQISIDKDLFEGLAYAVEHDQLKDCLQAKRYRNKGVLDGVDVTVPDEHKVEGNQLTLTIADYLEFIVLQSANKRR